MPRVLSVYLPRWPVLLACRQARRASPSAAVTRGPSATARNAPQCVLLVDTARGKQYVHDCCAQAARVGVRPGITLAHARALVGRYITLEAEHQPAEDEKKLQRLARWALRFAPTVAPDPPDGLFLDISGCGPLFGGEYAQVKAIDESLRRLGLPARLATAPTYGAAWALARFGSGRVSSVADHEVRTRLNGLPVEALRLDAKTRAALAEVDICRVGELLDLPRDELATRYGRELLTRLQQALGDVYEALEPVRVEVPLTVTYTFDGPVRSARLIEETVQTLLDELLALLAQRGKGAYELLLTFWRVDVGPLREHFRFTQATRAGKHIWSMIQNRLHALRIGHGVEEITLETVRSDDLHGEQTAMWGRDEDGHADAEALGRLVDRLVDRLGDDAVTALAPVESHVPELAFESVAPLAKATVTAPLPRGARRPSILLAQPEAARVIALFPNGPPSWMQWRGEGLEIAAADGPERIMLPWWRRDAGAARDYYTVHDQRGRCLWLFRAREGCADGQWFVQGVWG